MTTIVIYQSNKEIGRGNKPHRENLNTDIKQRVFRVLFMDLEDNEIRAIESLARCNLASVLNSSLERNEFTRYMN